MWLSVAEATFLKTIVDVEVPFEVEDNTYFFSFYEVEMKDKALNLFPVVFDIFFNAAFDDDEFETYTFDSVNPITT